MMEGISVLLKASVILLTEVSDVDILEQCCARDVAVLLLFVWSSGSSCDALDDAFVCSYGRPEAVVMLWTMCL